MMDARPLRKPCLLLRNELISEEPPGDIGAFRLGVLDAFATRLLLGMDSPIDKRLGAILFSLGDMWLVAEFKELLSFGS